MKSMDEADKFILNHFKNCTEEEQDKLYDEIMKIVKIGKREILNRIQYVVNEELDWTK